MLKISHSMFWVHVHMQCHANPRLSFLAQAFKFACSGSKQVVRGLFMPSSADKRQFDGDLPSEPADPRPRASLSFPTCICNCFKY
jgi:hypothetical protein